MVCARNNCSFSLEPLRKRFPPLPKRRHSALSVPKLGFKGSYLSAGTEAGHQGLGTLKEANSFQLGSETSLLLSGQLALPHLQREEKHKHTKKSCRRAPEAHVLIHAGVGG